MFSCKFERNPPISANKSQFDNQSYGDLENRAKVTKIVIKFFSYPNLQHAKFLQHTKFGLNPTTDLSYRVQTSCFWSKRHRKSICDIKK